MNLEKPGSLRESIEAAKRAQKEANALEEGGFVKRGPLDGIGEMLER